MGKLEEVSSETLEFIDTLDVPRIVWIKAEVAASLLWAYNPKLHDMGDIIQSIEKHGFQELPKYDATLGAIKAGNGRVEAIARMEKDKKSRQRLRELGLDVPRGIAQEKTTGAWVIPLLVGIDAPSIALAESYAIDSNNLTMAGGDFTAVDMAKMWDSQGYLEALERLESRQEYPVTVDADTLSRLRQMLTDDSSSQDLRGALLDKFSKFGVLNPEKYLFEEGTSFEVDGRHIIVFADIFRQYNYFVHFMTADRVFIPFAGAYIFATDLAKDFNLLVVQSNPSVFSLIYESTIIVYGKEPQKL